LLKLSNIVLVTIRRRKSAVVDQNEIKSCWFVWLAVRSRIGRQGSCSVGELSSFDGTQQVAGFPEQEIL
jgi:hypothetical protein